MALNPPYRPRPAPHARGDILLVTLIMLLLLLLAVVVGLRSGIANTLMTGNTLARQKDVMTGDIALRVLEGQMVAAAGGQALEVVASAQPWYRDVAAGTAAPADSYWNSCLGNGDATLRCGSVSMTVNGNTIPYTAYAVVQPTGRSDATACSLAQYRAIYYDVFVRINESGGGTGTTTETIYRLCTLN